MSAELNIIDASQKLFSINKTDIIFEISSNKITNINICLDEAKFIKFISK